MAKTLVGSLLAAAAVLGLVVPAQAGSKAQMTLVPTVAGTTPGFSARGSSVKVDGTRHVVSGKLKNVVDAGGLRLTTDPATTGDEYSVEVDLEVLPTAATTTVSASFELKNGNGGFSVSLDGNPVFDAAALGDGIGVRAVRVKDALGAVVGSGGIAKE